MKKDYDSTKIYRKTQKKGASQTYDTPSFLYKQPYKQPYKHTYNHFFKEKSKKVS